MKRAALLLSLTACLTSVPAPAALQAPTAQALRSAVLEAERLWLATAPDRSFLSVGNDLGYALDWLKAGRYTEAMTPLRLVGEKGAADPYVHLFTALAMAGQGQQDQALAALDRAARLDPSLGTFRARLALASPPPAPAAARSPAPVAAPPSPASAPTTLPAARKVTTMAAALDEAARLWKATQPSTAMFSTNWHVEQILSDLRNGQAAGAKVDIAAARDRLTSGSRELDRVFLDLFAAFAAAQLGQRPALDQALSALARTPAAAPLQPLTDFLNGYQPPRAAPAPAPAPASRPGGPLVPGNYACWLERPGLYGTRNDLPQGTLTLKANGTYTYMGKVGTFSYNPQSGVLTFTGGFFTQPTPERTTFLRHQKTAQIDIHWAYANDWSCGRNL